MLGHQLTTAVVAAFGNRIPDRLQIDQRFVIFDRGAARNGVDLEALYAAQTSDPLLNSPGRQR